jgi:ABC-2 type transport system permease protein
MSRAPRYFALFRTQLRASVLLALQYRTDFLFDALVELFWAVSAVVPLLVVFHARPHAFGYQLGEALLVTSFFLVLEGIIEGAINPSLTTVVEHVRKGTLDFILLKPADAQFLVSTARFSPWRGANAISATVLATYAFLRLGHAPRTQDVLLSLLLLCASIVILYSLWTLTVSAAFYVVRVDNLTFLFSSLFDAARWPASVFRGFLRILFTFILPFGVMTTFPAEALLGRLPWRSVVLALVLAAAFALLARVVWLRSLSRYTSAGG